MEPSRDQELPHKISKGSYSHRINHFLLWHTHTRLLRWNSLASYLISRLLPLFCCKTLMNTHSVMKRSEAEEFREQRVKTTVLFQSFSNVLEAFKCKLQHIFNSLLSKERKKKIAPSGWPKWNVMNKNNHFLFPGSHSVLGKMIFQHLVNKRKKVKANLFGGRDGLTNETCWHMY